MLHSVQQIIVSGQSVKLPVSVGTHTVVSVDTVSDGHSRSCVSGQSICNFKILHLNTVSGRELSVETLVILSVDRLNDKILLVDVSGHNL